MAAPTDLPGRLQALEHAAAEVLNTANRLAILNAWLLDLGLPRVNCHQLGMTYEAIERQTHEAEKELHRRAMRDGVTV